jgi:hypothetical protein
MNAEPYCICSLCLWMVPVAAATVPLPHPLALHAQEARSIPSLLLRDSSQCVHNWNRGGALMKSPATSWPREAGLGRQLARGLSSDRWEPRPRLPRARAKTSLSPAPWDRGLAGHGRRCRQGATGARRAGSAPAGRSHDDAAGPAAVQGAPAPSPRTSFAPPSRWRCGWTSPGRYCARVQRPSEDLPEVAAASGRSRGRPEIFRRGSSVILALPWFSCPKPDVPLLVGRRE